MAGSWRLPDAYAAAATLLARTDRAKARRELLKSLNSKDPELRKRTADVARRITEKDRSFLQDAADELAWILSETPLGESRTRWHLGLVVARMARTHRQVAVAIELMWRLADDPSNVVRCSALEGLGELVPRAPELRDQAEEHLRTALRTGTLAMKCRAKHALAKIS